MGIGAVNPSTHGLYSPFKVGMIQKLVRGKRCTGNVI
jgi:hypothetical protein